MEPELYLKLTLTMHTLRFVQPPHSYVFRSSSFTKDSWVVDLFRMDASRKVTIELEDATFVWERATEEEYNEDSSNESD